MNHEDVNPTTGEVDDKHFWLVVHDGFSDRDGTTAERYPEEMARFTSNYAIRGGL